MANIIDRTNLINKSVNQFQDVDTATIPPTDGGGDDRIASILKYDTGGNVWQTDAESFFVSVNREALAGTKTMDVDSEVYQYLDPNGSNKDVILPNPAVEGMFYNIKSLDGNDAINVYAQSGDLLPVQQLSFAQGILETYFIYDGTEWHALGPGIFLPAFAGFSEIDTTSLEFSLSEAGGFSEIDSTTLEFSLAESAGYSDINDASILAP